MEEGYIRPGDALFGVATSVIIGIVMGLASRPMKTEGRQTMFGIPKTDVERLMSHYGISEDEASELLATYPIDLLLPERGSGLAPVEIIGSTQEELASGLMMMEGSMNVGEKARLTFCTEALPSDEDLAVMFLEMSALGCHVSYPTAAVVEGIPTTEFVMQKGSPAWPLIIPLIIPLFTIGLVAFGITKIETITKALVPIILISLGGLIVLAAVLSKPATNYIERGGKVPYLPSAKKKKPDRDDVRVEVWEERDRLHIGIQDRIHGNYYANWWDDEARQMFEDGFFKSGKQLEDSVLDYAEDVGILAKEGKRLALTDSKKALAVG